MKKTIFAFGMMLAATLSLTNCSKEMDAPQEVSKDGVPFELFADVAQTKTAITGWATRWVQDDKINLFHAVAGTTAYVDDGQFSVDATDLTVGRFTGTIAPENLPVSGKYDWYAIYPYSSYIKSPANTGSNPGRVTIGKASNQAQVQTGNDATNHLSGSAFPLYGVATDVDFDASPSITLNNIVSVVEVKVTNKNDAPLVVNSVSFTAPEGTTIVGQYEISYAANPMTFTDYSTNTSSVANLTVNNGAAIAKDAYASFYIGIKPFTATTGQVLKLSVNGYEKSVTLTKDFTFASGKIKTLAFDYDQDPQGSTTFVFNTDAGIAELSIAKPSSGAGTNLTGPYTKNNVSVSFDKSTATNNPRVWNSNGSLDLRIYNHNIITFQAPAGYNITKIEFDSNGSYTAASGTYSGKTWTGSASEVVLTKGSSTHNINTIQVTCSQQQTVPTITDAVVTGADVHGGTGLTKDIVLSYFDAAPSLTATPDGSVVTAASVDNVTASGATVTYTLAPNYSSTAAVGTITVSDGAGHEGVITVNQDAAVFTVSRTSIELNANTGATANFTVNSDFDWTIDDSSLNGFTVTPNSFTYAGNRAQSVTITATGNNATANIVDLDIFCVTRTADSQNSEVITVKQKSGKLAKPTLSVTPDAANKKFTVSWTAVPNASKYVYYVEDKDHNDKISLTETTDASTLSFEVADINLGEEYYVSVYAEGNNNPWIDSDVTTETVKVNEGATREVISGTFTSSNGTLTLTTTSGITITQSKTASNATAPNASYNTATTLRVYKNNKLSFSGKNITKIELTHTDSNKGCNGITANTGTYSQGTTLSTWTGEATSVEITNTGDDNRQLRPTQIVVYYTD